jgi:transcriptional regulator with XRE-family HTH domain
MLINSEKLKSLRIAKRITQCELSKSAGVTQGMISQIELGCRNVSIDTMAQIANILGCSIDELSKDGEPTSFTKLVRNCKLLTEKQIDIINSVVVQLINH